MVVKLPMEKSPIIKTYNTRSFPLGILQAQGDKTWPWIYNKFINCVYFPYQERKFDICMEDWWFTRSQVFSVQLLRLTPEYLSFNSINIISIIQECIDKANNILHQKLRIYFFYMVYLFRKEESGWKTLRKS